MKWVLLAIPALALLAVAMGIPELRRYREMKSM